MKVFIRSKKKWFYSFVIYLVEIVFPTMASDSNYPGQSDEHYDKFASWCDIEFGGYYVPYCPGVLDTCTHKGPLGQNKVSSEGEVSNNDVTSPHKAGVTRPKKECDRRLFDITYNNPSQQLAKKLFEYARERALYFAFCYEFGLAEETPHLQCMIELKRQTKYCTFNKIFDNKLSMRALESLDSDNLRNYILRRDAYSHKEGLIAGPWEMGKYTRYVGFPGNACAHILEMVKERASMKEIMVKHPSEFMRHKRGIVDLKNAWLEKERQWETNLMIFQGPAGCGKSKTAKLIMGYAFDDGYYKKPKGVSFDNYEYQPGVLWDEYNNDVEPEWLLDICDRDPTLVRCLYGAPKWAAALMFITSNKQWWRELCWDDEQLYALGRRCLMPRWQFDMHPLTRYHQERKNDLIRKRKYVRVNDAWMAAWGGCLRVRMVMKWVDVLEIWVDEETYKEVVYDCYTLSWGGCVVVNNIMYK